MLCITAFVFAGLLQLASGTCPTDKRLLDLDGEIHYRGVSKKRCSWILSLDINDRAVIVKVANISMGNGETNCSGYLQIPGHGGSCDTIPGACFLFAKPSTCTLETMKAKISEYGDCAEIHETQGELSDRRIVMIGLKSELKSFGLTYKYFSYGELCDQKSTEKSGGSATPTPSSRSDNSQGVKSTSTTLPQSCGVPAGLVVIAVLLALFLGICLLVIVWMHRRYKRLLSGENSTSVPLSRAEYHTEDPPSPLPNNTNQIHVYNYVDEAQSTPQASVYTEIANGHNAASDAGATAPSLEERRGQSPDDTQIQDISQAPSGDVYAVVNKPHREQM